MKSNWPVVWREHITVIIKRYDTFSAKFRRKYRVYDIAALLIYLDIPVHSSGISYTAIHCLFFSFLFF